MDLKAHMALVLACICWLHGETIAAVIGNSFDFQSFEGKQDESDHRLQKRSDCTTYGQKGIWNIDCPCNHRSCSDNSFRRAFRTVCSSGQPCYLSNKGNAYWSPSYQGKDTFLVADCSPDVSCGDGMADYTCTCLSGYTNQDCDLETILPATIVPVVGLLLIALASVLIYRWYQQRKKQKGVAPVTSEATDMPSNVSYKNKTLVE